MYILEGSIFCLAQTSNVWGQKRGRWALIYKIFDCHSQVPLANNLQNFCFKRCFSVWKLPSLLRDQRDYKRLENVTSVASCSVVPGELRKAGTVFAGWQCLHRYQPCIACSNLAFLWQEVERVGFSGWFGVVLLPSFGGHQIGWLGPV